MLPFFAELLEEMEGGTALRQNHWTRFIEMERSDPKTFCKAVSYIRREAVLAAHYMNIYHEQEGV